MRIALATLEKNGLIRTWHDQMILAGQNWSKKIRSELESSDLITFLITPDFLNSEACIEEWELAKARAENSSVRLISIIVRDCAWKDFDSLKTFEVLPSKGKPVSTWEDEDSAWQNVYEGIKNVIDEIRTSFLPVKGFAESLNKIEFCSQTRDVTLLEDVFVFPQIYAQLNLGDKEKHLQDIDDLLQYDRIILIGEQQSGKTKLLSRIFSDLSGKASAVLFVDLDDIRNKNPSKKILEKLYNEQFEGDFEYWIKQEKLTVVFDNLSNSANSLEHVKFCKNDFLRIIVATSSDDYHAFFKDEVHLADYTVVRFAPFSHSKQELLIKKWLALSSNKDLASSDAELEKIDKIERDINSIIISNKVVPRYPFYILSILQTHEVFMPTDIQITAYGHCYFALILARIIKSGIERTDENINACFNFSSHLAIFIHKKAKNTLRILVSDYYEFISEYRDVFIIPDSVLSRICGEQGILKMTSDGYVHFSVPYSYFFFLGRQLANTYKENNKDLFAMMEKSYLKENTLALTFAIHHANDTNILDDILAHTIYAVDTFEPAKLDKNETKLFNELLTTIPQQILSDRSIEEERNIERQKRDRIEENQQEESDTNEENEAENQINVLQKNIQILSQILKNKAGSLRKDKIEEVIQTICDAGLRLISICLCSEDELMELTKYLEKKYGKVIGFKKSEIESVNTLELAKVVRFTIFAWTMKNVESIVDALCKPELREIMRNVRDANNTPAYDIIYYFYSLDVSESFDDYQKVELDKLMKKYDSKDYSFLRRVLSLRTQHYLNTHKVKGPVKQAVQSVLKLNDKNSAARKY